MIADSAASPRVFYARDHNICTVSLKWIDDCYHQIQYLEYKPYIIPLYLGCIFASTDIVPRRNRYLQKLITTNGGEFSTQLNNSTTFLLSSTLSNSQKCKIAISANIPIVNPEWIEAATPCSPINYIINFWCITDQPRHLFDNMTFVLDPPSNDLTVAIQANGGKIVDSNPTYTVVPHGRSGDNFVTARFVYASISQKKIVNASEYAPFPFTVPVIEMRIALLHFEDDIERLALADDLRVLGAKVQYVASRDLDLIVSPVPDRKARQVPVVAPSWVRELRSTGRPPENVRHMHNGGDDGRRRFEAICEALKRSAVSPQPPPAPPTTTVDYNQLDVFSQLSQVSSPDRSEERSIDVEYLPDTRTAELLGSDIEFITSSSSSSDDDDDL